jgi:hypothetical protein
VIGKIRIRKEKSSVVATLFSDLGLTVVNNTFCSPTDVTIMQPSRVADFGALAQSAGFRIEDLANFGTSMWLCSQSDMLLITYLLHLLFSRDFNAVHVSVEKIVCLHTVAVSYVDFSKYLSSNVDVQDY